MRDNLCNSFKKHFVGTYDALYNKHYLLGTSDTDICHIEVMKEHPLINQWQGAHHVKKWRYIQLSWGQRWPNTLGVQKETMAMLLPLRRNNDWSISRKVIARFSISHLFALLSNISVFHLLPQLLYKFLRINSSFPILNSTSCLEESWIHLTEGINEMHVIVG